MFIIVLNQNTRSDGLLMKYVYSRVYENIPNYFKSLLFEKHVFFCFETRIIDVFAYRDRNQKKNQLNSSPGLFLIKLFHLFPY